MKVFVLPSASAAFAAFAVFAAAFARGADCTFTAGAWKVSYTEEGSALSLVHRPSQTAIDGEFVFEGAAKLFAVTNRLVLKDAASHEVGSVGFSGDGDQLELCAVAEGEAQKGTFFFEGHVQYRADAFACSAVPLAEEEVCAFSLNDADSRLNDALYSPTNDEAFVTRSAGATFRAVDRGRYELAFSLVPASPTTAVAEFRVARDYYRRRWAPAYRPGQNLPAWKVLLSRFSFPDPKSPQEREHVLQTLALFLKTPGVRPTALYPPESVPCVWNLGIRREAIGQDRLVAVFNTLGEAAECSVDWGDLGEEDGNDFIVYDLWNESWLGVLRTRLKSQVPAKSVQLFALKPYLGRPQFLAFADAGNFVRGVTRESWADDVLAVTLDLPAGKQTTLRFAVPESFTLGGISAPPSVTVAAPRREAGGKIVAVTLASAAATTATLRLSFK